MTNQGVDIPASGDGGYAGATTSGFPRIASFHSTSTSSQSRRRSWADVTDDTDTSSDDPTWTPTSSSAPHIAFGSASRSSSVSVDPSHHDDAGEFHATEPRVESCEPLLKLGVCLSSELAATHDERNAGSGLGRRARKKASSASAPRTPADDAQFWAEASSTAASSGSEHPRDRERPTPQWSKGAESHADGTCHPCIFFPKAVGCENGAECPYCHLDHESKVRHRRHMRRGRGRVEAGSESKEDTDPSVRHDRQTDPEEVTFMLPSALLRAQTAWREVSDGKPFPEHDLNGTSCFPSSVADLTGQARSSRKGGLRTPSSSASSVQGGADTTQTQSVFTSFFSPLFGAGETTTNADVDQCDSRLEVRQGRRRRGKGKDHHSNPLSGNDATACSG